MQQPVSKPLLELVTKGQTSLVGSGRFTSGYCQNGARRQRHRTRQVCAQARDGHAFDTHAALPRLIDVFLFFGARHDTEVHPRPPMDQIGR